MKKIISILIISIFILSSCSNPEDLKKIEELENRINDDVFNKKQECLKYSDTIFNQLKESYKSNNFTSYQIEVPKIYFSSKINSCIASTEVIHKSNNSVIHVLELKNILNNEIIDGVTCYLTATGDVINGVTQIQSEDLKNYSNCTAIYNNQLEKLIK